MAIVSPGLGNHHFDQVIPETGLLYPAKKKKKKSCLFCENCEGFFSKIYTYLFAKYFSAA